MIVTARRHGIAVIDREAVTSLFDGLSAVVRAALAAALEHQEGYGSAAYYISLFRAADEAKKDKRDQDSKALRALGWAFSMMLEPRSAPAPFRAVMQMENGRSALPEDLDAEAIALFRSVIAASKNPEVRARLSDLIWLRERDAAVARLAIQSYFETAESDHLKFVHDRMNRLIRGTQIALQLNPQGGERDELMARLAHGATRYAVAGEAQCALEVLEFAVAQDLLDAKAGLAKLDEILGSANSISRSLVRRSVLLMKAQLHARLDDRTRAKDLTVQAAETFVAEANSVESGLAKSHFLEQAIHVLRGVRHYRAHADVVARIDELKAKLMELRDHVLASMQVNKFGPYDLSESVQQALLAVAGREPREALLQIARMLKRPMIDSLRESAIQSLKGTFLSRLFGARHLGTDGRTVGKRDSGDLGGDPSEPEILAHMRQTASWHRRFMLSGFIDPARQSLNQQRYISEGDLQWLFDGNPMVPHGHESILLRGLLAGIRDDFQVAGALLIPQVETLLRHRLNAQGIVTTGFDKDGIEDELPLERLIELAEQRGVMDASVAFDLRALLTERTSENLRNEHAHGLIVGAGYYGDGTRYLWAWVLQWLCIYYLKQEDAQAREEQSSDPSSQL